MYLIKKERKERRKKRRKTQEEGVLSAVWKETIY